MKEISYFIGWDVGGWNCDKNPRSRDALVIIDKKGKIHGDPWRGNLRDLLNSAQNTRQLIEGFFALCNLSQPESLQTLLAIDTPLGFSEQFISLITDYQVSGEIADSSTNNYLYRQTERFLFQQGLSPLSAIKDMIGSQATKGIHLLARYAPTIVRCGIWTDGHILWALEAYPSACRKSSTILQLLKNYPELPHLDQHDALICALLAKLLQETPEIFWHPPTGVPENEGWIWLPSDTVSKLNRT